MSSQQDRQRVMDELKITLFPSGPEPTSLDLDEAPRIRIPNCRIPDIQRWLEGEDRSAVNRRRAENRRLFDREVYGRRPKNIPKVAWTVAGTTESTTAGVPMVTKN
jgi:hypothetical protein